MVSDARFFLQVFDDVALLRNTDRMDEDGDESWSVERRQAYKANARKFLEVTRRMADLEWTRQDWQFLAKRNKRTLLSSAEGKATYDREFKDAPLLFDGKKRNARGEDGADRYNAERLEQLLRETESCLPILGIRALHVRPKGAKTDRMNEKRVCRSWPRQGCRWYRQGLHAPARFRP